MFALEILLMIALAGVFVWILTKIPMPEVFRSILIGVAVILLILWFMQILGVNTGLPKVHLIK